MRCSWKIIAIMMALWIWLGVGEPRELSASETESVLHDPSSTAPHPKFERMIDLSSLGKSWWVLKLTYSPDGQYLGVIVSNHRRSDIVIWDLAGNKLQARIEGSSDFGTAPQVELQWSRDSRSITTGSAARDIPMLIWDPMSGVVQKELVVDRQISRARYNRDGSKLLVSTTSYDRLGDHPGFRVYDTKSWNFEDFDGEGLSIETLSWTADDEVLVAGRWPKKSVGRIIDGITPKMMDILVRVIDPSGQYATRSIILAASAPPDNPAIPFAETFGIGEAVPDFAGNRVSLSVGSIFDVKAMQNWRYATDSDIMSGKIPVDSRAFSPNGHYLYLKGDVRFGTGLVGRNVVLDAYSGLTVDQFDGGHAGIAVSPDGQHIAIGNGYASVEILSVE